MKTYWVLRLQDLKIHDIKTDIPFPQHADLARWPMLVMSLPVAQWLELPTGVRKVMGSIPVGDLDFFFVPRSRHVEYSIFSYV